MSDATNLTPKVSILVPICNVEKYLTQCLDSIIAQTLRDLEIICINDGSTDGSLAIIEDYAGRDERIVVIDKPNSGYGDSMNVGLARATGEYVGIVESDDWAEAMMFEELYALAKDFDADVVKSNFYFFYTADGSNVRSSDIHVAQTGRLIDMRKEIFPFYIQPSIWAALYRRSLLVDNGIKFLPSPGASFQDTGFNFKVWACAQRAVFSPQAYLHYRSDNQASSVKSKAKVFALKEEYDETRRFLEEMSLFSKYGELYERMKLGSYLWNLDRLSKAAATQFAEVFTQEFARAQAEGRVSDALFTDDDRNTISLISTNLSRYFRQRRVRRIGAAVKNALEKVLRFLLPTYRRSRKLVALNYEILCQNDDLIFQLTCLESRLSRELDKTSQTGVC